MKLKSKEWKMCTVTVINDHALFLYLFMFKLLLPSLLLYYMTPINIRCFVVDKLFNNNNHV